MTEIRYTQGGAGRPDSPTRITFSFYPSVNTPPLSGIREKLPPYVRVSEPTPGAFEVRGVKADMSRPTLFTIFKKMAENAGWKLVSHGDT